MVYRNGGPLRHYERWYFKDTKLEVVSNYKYLGLYFNPKLCQSLTRPTLAKQAAKAVFRIMKRQRYFRSFSPKDTFKLFDMIVRPILCYGAEIWGYQYLATKFSQSFLLTESTIEPRKRLYRKPTTRQNQTTSNTLKLN